MTLSTQPVLSNALYATPLEELYGTYTVDPDHGLTPSQIQANLTAFGINELKKVERSFFKVVIAPIINLLIIIYLISAFAMALLGAINRTIPTFIIVGFNAVVAIVQQFRAEKQLQALQKLSEATIEVMRSSRIIEIPNSEIVVGDIVILKTGDKVPADCRVITARNLAVDESSLTGESRPVRKTNGICEGDENNLPLQQQNNMLFMGTFVTAGNGTAIVVKIGQDTEIGKISQKLEQTSTGDIPLRNKLNHVAKFLGIGVVILLILSIIWRSIILLNGNPFVWDDFKDALIISIDLGMKVMPINLPVLTTIVLLTGVLVMAQKGVIIRELSRTESLGRVSVVCTDKTGTLTKNEMTVQKIWTYAHEYNVEGTGYEPVGEIKSEEITNPPIALNDPDLIQLVYSGYLNNNSHITSEMVKIVGARTPSVVWKVTGAPTEAALKVLGRKFNPKFDKLSQYYTLLQEYSFSSELKRMSQVYQNEQNTILYIKGATERILNLCTNIQIEGKVHEITENHKSKILQAMKNYAGMGYRILSIGYRNLNSDQDQIAQLQQEDSRNLFETNITYLGFVVISDPPRDDVKQAIIECKSAGIQTVMITGDNLITAKAIGQSLRIFDPEQHLAIEGNNIEKLSTEDFQKVTIFARVSPEHKQIIVQRYQELGRVVSMSGDGVNDALALSMADCGVAMGIQGTEVAKEAADMIITDDSFSTIVTGIREGRGLFEKIRTIIYFFVLVSVMEAIILFTSTLNFTDPFFEMWSYWQLNLLYLTAHMFPSLGFTFGSYSKTLMDDPPRDSAEIITKNLMKIMIIQMILMGLAIALSYYLSMWGVIGLNEGNAAYGSYYRLDEFGVRVEAIVAPSQIKARTMGFVVLFLMESFIMPLQIRRINEPIEKSLKDISYWKEFWLYLPSFVILIIVIYSVPLQESVGRLFNESFNFMSLSVTDWLICLGLSIPAFIAFELIRRRFWKKGVIF